MTLPASGAISFYDINIELGRSGTATIGIDEAENGTYGTIQKCSLPRPNPTNPASINEWYSYNHNANATADPYNPFDYSATSCAAACALPVAGNYALWSYAGGYWLETTCINNPTPGYYADVTRAICRDIGSGGVLNGTSPCTTTTTTTTSTTTASPCVCISNQCSGCGGLDGCYCDGVDPNYCNGTYGCV